MISKSVTTSFFLVFLLLVIPPVYAASLSDLLGGSRCEELLAEKDKAQAQLLKNNQTLLAEKQDLEKGLVEIKKQNTQLIDACQNVDTDRENLMLQSERLRRENGVLQSAKDAYERITVENETLKTAKEAIEKDLKELQGMHEVLKGEEAAVSQERDDLQAKLMEATENQKPFLKRIEQKYSDRIKKLDDQLDDSRKENKELSKDLKSTRKDVEVLEREKFRWVQQANVTQSKLEELEKQFEAAQKENVALKEETRTFPRRFTDLANQNQRLIKETADMHYNLGVFYVKEKNFKRAIHEFEQVLNLKPEDPQAHYNLGYIYAEHVLDRHKAMEYFKNYLSYAPDAQDADWVKKYLLTWETWYGKTVLK